MYYYVREGFSDSKISEGFCKRIEFTNEMLNSEVKIDGQIRMGIDIGDKIVLTVDPAFNLRCLKIL